MSKKVLIIGGGIVGCLSAIEFKDKGYDVTIADKSNIGQEASSAAAGILFPLLPWKYDDEVYELCINSSKFFEKLEKKFKHDLNIDFELLNSGLLINPPLNEIEIFEWANKKKISISKKNDSVFIPNVYQINPLKLMYSIKKYIQKIGVKLLENCEIIKFEFDNNIIKSAVTKKNIFLSSDIFVLSAGAWTSLINSGLKKKIKPIRGQIIQYHPIKYDLEHILYKNGIYILQRKNKSIIVGSTMEDVGFSKKNIDKNISYLDQKAKSILPELLNVNIEKSWFGYRPGVNDNIPIVSRDNYFFNMYIHAGHFRYGITMAPETTKKLISFF